jgi:ubiquinone/menaquinone biosynthesis C-methylase UbiE
MGKGTNAVRVQKDFNADVIGIDVIDYNRSPVRLVLYDGRTIPFEDDEFDVALVNGVFHHCDDPVRIFEEAVRVAHRVIIMEDVYTSKIHLQIIKLYDFLINFRHGVNTPFHFMKHADWMNLFEERGLKTIVAERYAGKPFYSPMQAMFYVLDK